MSSRYVLTSFYAVEYADGGRIWHVYGHIHAGRNEDLGEFRTEYEAMKKAHSFGVPAIRGEGGRVFDATERLSHATNS